MSDAGERLREQLKRPYDEDGDVWKAITEGCGQEFDKQIDTLDEIEDNKFVDTADLPQLRKIASLFDLSQREGETVEELKREDSNYPLLDLTMSEDGEIDSEWRLKVNNDAYRTTN